MPRLLTDEEITRQLDDLPHWTRAAPHEITATFDLPGFAQAVAFVSQVADLAEEMDHHPDIDIRFSRVTLSLWTHSENGLTQLDIELAHRINQVEAGT